jgi:DNA-binding CsgD family transcriptional regulator
MFENPEQAFGGTGPLLELVESIYATVQDPALWTSVLARISSAIQGQSLALFAVFPDSKAPGIVALHEMPPAVWNLFAVHYASVNPIMPRCEAALEAGATAYSHHVISNTDLERTEFYSDFFRPNEMYHSAGLRIRLEGHLSANLSCQRAKSLGEFDGRAETVYQTLKPHLQRALMLHHQLGSLLSKSLGLQTALDAFEHAVFGMDRGLRVIFTNRQADAVALSGDAISLSKGRIFATCPGQDKPLQKLLLESIGVGSGLAQTSGGSLLLERKSLKHPLRLTVSPFATPLPGCSAQLAALVFVSDPESRPQSRAATLRTLYALTPAEARVADLLLHGQEMREVATGLGLTLETARFHTKRVLFKTGTRRQAELMRLMLSLPSPDNNLPV